MIRPFLAALSIVAGGFVAIMVAESEVPSEPDPQLTPGEVVSSDRDIACAWGRSPRLYDTDKAAYIALERAVFAAYGLAYNRRGECEFDHLVPRCIGGADTARNLWPQHCDRWSPGHLHCLAGPAADKDVDEIRICRAVCRDGTMSIADGQRFFTE